MIQPDRFRMSAMALGARAATSLKSLDHLIPHTLFRTLAACPCSRRLLSCSLMPTDHILALLIAERDKLNRAIEALQGPSRRRGRPPKNPLTAIPIAAANLASPETKKRRGMSAAARKAQGARMKAYWAKRRKQANK
jgi:hypothetical protein